MDTVRIEEFLRDGRLLHSINVAEMAHRVGVDNGYHPEFIEVLCKAAELHDIGKSERLAFTGFHPLDGFFYLQHVTDMEVAAVCLLHTDAAESVRYCDMETAMRYERALSQITMTPVLSMLVEIVSLCDKHCIGDTGELVEMGDKLAYVIAKYGEDHPFSIVDSQNFGKYVELKRKYWR